MRGASAIAIWLATVALAAGGIILTALAVGRTLHGSTGLSFMGFLTALGAFGLSLASYKRTPRLLWTIGLVALAVAFAVADLLIQGQTLGSRQ